MNHLDTSKKCRSMKNECKSEIRLISLALKATARHPSSPDGRERLGGCRSADKSGRQFIRNGFDALGVFDAIATQFSAVRV